MFQTFEKPNVLQRFGALFTFGIQFAIVYPALVVATLPLLTYVHRKIPIAAPPGYEAHFQECPIMLLAGFLLGVSTAKSLPSLIRTGRWLFTVPAAFFLVELLNEGLRQPPYNQYPSEAFYSGANEGLKRLSNNTSGFRVFRVLPRNVYLSAFGPAQGPRGSVRIDALENLKNDRHNLQQRSGLQRRGETRDSPRVSLRARVSLRN